MDSPKLFFSKTFSIPQHIIELQNHNCEETKKPKSFIKTLTKFGSNYSTLLTTWFDFAYFCCISPFRFTKIHPKNGFDIVRKKFQNAICAVGHMSTLMMYLGDVRSTSPSGQNPVAYLDFFMVHATLIRHFFLVLILWRKSTLFQDIINILDARRPLIHKYCTAMRGPIKHKGHIPKKWMALLIVSVYFLFAIFIVIIDPIIHLSQSESFKLTEFKHWENRVKFIYFVPISGQKNHPLSEAQHRPPVVWTPQGGISEIGVTGSNSEIKGSEYNSLAEEKNIEMKFEGANISASAVKQRRGGQKPTNYTPNYPLIIFATFGTIMRYLFGCYSDCLMLLIVLSLWFPATDFAKFIRRLGNNCRQPLSTLDSLAEYRELKKLSNLINASIKHLLIFVVLQAIFFYPVGVKQVVATCDFSGVYYIGFFLVSFCLTFYYAADICKQMHSFQIYLRDEENRWELSKLDLYMLLQETTTNPVGIADEGRFVIDYPFVATITGTLMTYFVVSVQYEQCGTLGVHQ